MSNKLKKLRDRYNDPQLLSGIVEQVEEQHEKVVKGVIESLPVDLKKISTRHKDPIKLCDTISFPGGDWVEVALRRTLDSDKMLLKFQTLVTFCFDGVTTARGGGKAFYVRLI